MAQMMHLPNIARHKDIELRWLCDINEQSLKQAAEKFGPVKVTADAAEIAADQECQAVLISTTQTVRLPLIELFARAGKHMFVEKPLADSFEELRKILKIVDETGVKLQVGHNRRMAPATREAVRILNKHRANPVSPAWRWDREGKDRPTLPDEKATMVLLRINDDYWSWKKWAFAHGPLINEMTHFADLACCFIDSDPVRVTTTGDKFSNHVVTMQFADKSMATVFATPFGSFGYPKELVEVYHNGAAIIIDHLMEVRAAGIEGEPFRTEFGVLNDRNPEIEAQGIEGFYQRVLAAEKLAIEKGDNSLLPGQPDKGHFALLDDFVQCVRTGREPVCSARVAAPPTAIILRALESEEKGGVPVEMGPGDWTF
jgi:predicted dehydrogenase